MGGGAAIVETQRLMPAQRIGDYAFLSDCNAAALVAGEGSVDWYCLPRFDSPSVFGRMLGSDAGHWLLGPAGGGREPARLRGRQPRIAHRVPRGGRTR